MKNALMILIVGLAIALFATSSIAAEVLGVDIHGFISQGYLSSDETDFMAETENNSFAFSEVGINFGRELTDSLRFGIQLFAKDFSDLNNKNKIIVDWAYADYRFHEILGMRFGQIKFPHGLYNEARDIDMLRNTIFLPDSIYQELSYDLYVNDAFLSVQGISSRDLYLSLQGIGLYGYIDLEAAGGVSYQAMYGTQDIEPNNSVSERQISYFKMITPDIPLTNNSIENEDVNVDFKYAGNLLWDTPIDGLRLGASLNNMKMTVITRIVQDINYRFEDLNLEIPILAEGELAEVEYEKIENLVCSLEYTWENLIFMAEYLLTKKEYDVNAFENLIENFDDLGSLFGVEVDLNLGDTTVSETISGWYIGGAYRFTDWFELGGYYSQSRNEEQESSSFTGFSVNVFNEFDDICAATRFDINEYWTIKIEAHKFRSKYHTYDISALLDNLESIGETLEIPSTAVEEDWYMYAAKMTVFF